MRGRMAPLANSSKEPLEVLPEPGGMLRPHQVDRIEAGTLASG